MMNNGILKRLANVERLATATKLGRLLNNPYKYLYAIIFRKFLYPKTKAKTIEVPVFFGGKMKIALPASTDIYLTGGKSHDSEIRLVKFLIINLKDGDHFLDIGSHYGYFSLLANKLVGETGQIIAFEPSSESYEILYENCEDCANIKTYNLAVHKDSLGLSFYEFPNQYSEYNTSEVAQFENEQWFKDSEIKKLEIPSISIDELLNNESSFIPQVIKIDVEGGELNTIQGGLQFFELQSPTIVMEYLEPSRNNTPHAEATKLLRSLGYSTGIINATGSVNPIADIDQYLVSNGLESDNVVFEKK